MVWLYEGCRGAVVGWWGLYQAASVFLGHKTSLLTHISITFLGYVIFSVPPSIRSFPALSPLLHFPSLCVMYPSSELFTSLCHSITLSITFPTSFVPSSPSISERTSLMY